MIIMYGDADVNSSNNRDLGRIHEQSRVLEALQMSGYKTVQTGKRVLDFEFSMHDWEFFMGDNPGIRDFLKSLAFDESAVGAPKPNVTIVFVNNEASVKVELVENLVAHVAALKLLQLNLVNR